MYLIDTNILILGFAGKDPEARFLRRAIESDLVRVSVVTAVEFFTRATPKEVRAMNKLLVAFPVLEINLKTSRLAADYRRKFLKKTRVSLLDCLIAAQAKEHKLVLVTNNKADFPMKDIKVISP